MPAVLLTLSLLSAAAGPQTLPDSRPLDWDGDLAARMVAGIDRYLDRAWAVAPQRRREHWRPDHSSAEAYARSVEPNRRRLRTILGVVDPRRPPTGFELVATVDERPVVAETPRYRVLAVRWPVLDGVDGEGALVQPVGAVRAAAVVLPDADVTPEAAVGLGGYMFTGEYEMPEWDLGNTFNYAEMADLICPRPFMVERGHHDGVGLDEWVAFEYAKVRRRYAVLGIPGRTEIEFFNGGHKIHGAGTFEFLHRHLDWPKR